MPVRQTVSFALAPHPLQSFTPALELVGTLNRLDGALQANYSLRGDLHRLRIPGAKPARFVDELWRHTCFELFAGRFGSTSYYEYNFSPSGEWAFYSFDRYRDRGVQVPDAEREVFAPEMRIIQTGNKLELTALLPLALFSLPHVHAAMRLGLSAVLEAEDETGNTLLSYWALAHPVARPDFHHPDAFLLNLDELRN